MFIRRGPGLLGPVARTAVVAGTATAVSGRVARRQQQKYAKQDAAAQSQPAAEAPETYPTPADSDYAAELQRLAELNAAGVLTDEEFDAKKKQILGI